MRRGHNAYRHLALVKSNRSRRLLPDSTSSHRHTLPLRLPPAGCSFQFGRTSICRTRDISPDIDLSMATNQHIQTSNKALAIARPIRRRDENDNTIRCVGFCACNACSARLNNGSFGLLRLGLNGVPMRRRVFPRARATARRRTSISRDGRWRLLACEALSPQREIVAACPY